MPWSTSSNTSVGTASCCARTTFSASMSRESSPPEATFESGRASSPTLSCTSNVTSSAPCACCVVRGCNRAAKRPPCMPSAGSSSFTAFARRAAREAGDQLGRARGPARVDRLLELARQAPQLIGMGKALRLDVQRLHLSRPGCGLLDFFDDMAQVVRFAAHLLAGGRELLLAP